MYLHNFFGLGFGRYSSVSQFPMFFKNDTLSFHPLCLIKIWEFTFEMDILSLNPTNKICHFTNVAGVASRVSRPVLRVKKFVRFGRASGHVDALSSGWRCAPPLSSRNAMTGSRLRRGTPRKCIKRLLCSGHAKIGAQVSSTQATKDKTLLICRRQRTSQSALASACQHLYDALRLS